MEELSDQNKINVLDTLLRIVEDDHPEYLEEETTGWDVLGNGKIWLEELRSIPTEDEIKKFKNDWGQTHKGVCSELDYGLDGADELLIVDFFWIDKDELWCNKEASSFTQREQSIADYLRGN